MTDFHLDGYPGSVAAGSVDLRTTRLPAPPNGADHERVALPLGQLPLPFDTGDNLTLALMRPDESLHLLRDLVQTVDEMNARVEAIEEMLIHRY